MHTSVFHGERFDTLNYVFTVLGKGLRTKERKASEDVFKQLMNGNRQCAVEHADS